MIDKNEIMRQFDLRDQVTRLTGEFGLKRSIIADKIEINRVCFNHWLQGTTNLSKNKADKLQEFITDYIRRNT